MSPSAPILNMKITNPVYCSCPHGRSLLSGEKQQLLALSQPHFLWLQLLVPTHLLGVSSFLGLWLAELATLTSHPQWLTTLFGSAAGTLEFRESQAGWRQTASFLY